MGRGVTSRRLRPGVMCIQRVDLLSNATVLEWRQCSGLLYGFQGTGATGQTLLYW